MADRKASVALELQAGQFKAEAHAVERAIDKVDDKVEELDRDITKIPVDAAKAGAALKLLGADVKTVGDRVGSLGEKNTGLTLLDAKIRQTKSEVRKLADEFVRTGDIEVFKKLGQAEGHLRGLQDTRKKLAGALVEGVEDAAKVVGKTLAKGGIEAGTEFGKTFTAGLQGALSNPVVGPALGAALAPVAIAAVSFALAAIGGAVLAGIGGAAAGGGLAGAWMGNPKKYEPEWNASLERLRRRWLDSSVEFGQPLLDALHEADRVMRDLPVERLMEVSKGFVAPLAQGAGGGITNLVNGIADALDKVQPVIDKLGPGLSNLGNDLGDVFRMISEGSDGGAQALGDLISVIGYVARAVGLLILGFEKAYENIRSFVVATNDFISSVPVLGRVVDGARDSLFGISSTSISAGRALHGVGEAAAASAVNLGELMQQINATKLSADSLAGAMVGKIFDATMGLDQATLHWKSSLLAVSDALKTNGRDLSDNTEKGIANREAILASVTANMQIYQAQLQAGMTAADAAANYDVNTAALERQLRKAHLTQGEIDGLIGKYRGVPTQVNTNIAMNGLESAIRSLEALIREINHIPDRTVNVTVRYRTIGQSLNAPLAHGGIRRAQVGMIIPPSDPGTTLVGEPQTGGEALIPFQGISQGRAMDLMQQVGAGYGLAVSRYADMRSMGQMGYGGGGGMPQELVLNATFIDPMDGNTIRKQVIRWSLNNGRDPSTAFTSA